MRSDRLEQLLERAQHWRMSEEQVIDNRSVEAVRGEVATIEEEIEIWRYQRADHG
jgi:hypothetical protein